jgi:putative ABC transport system substrate-binding protein
LISQLAAFRAGLNKEGLREGESISIEFRWAEGNYERLSAMATELLAKNISVLIAQANAAALAAQKATSTIPIIFTVGGDPVRLGLVASLNRPGGNLTGFALFNDILIQKQLELIRELVPQTKTIAVLINPNNPDIAKRRTDIAATAKSLGMQFQYFVANADAEIDVAFAAIKKTGIRAVVVQNDPFLSERRDKIIAAAAKMRLPAIYGEQGHAVAGGLLAYGASRAAMYRELAAYTARILKGERPAELPVQHPTQFDLTINLRTAKALGITVPPTLLARADEVIE